MVKQFQSISREGMAEISQWINRANADIKNTPRVVISSDQIFVESGFLQSSKWIQQLEPARQLMVVLTVLRCVENLVRAYGFFVLNWKMVKINQQHNPIVWIHSNVKKNKREFPIRDTVIAEAIFAKNLRQFINYVYETPRQLTKLCSIIKYIDESLVWIGRTRSLRLTRKSEYFDSTEETRDRSSSFLTGTNSDGKIRQLKSSINLGSCLHQPDISNAGKKTHFLQLSKEQDEVESGKESSFEPSDTWTTQESLESVLMTSKSSLSRSPKTFCFSNKSRDLEANSPSQFSQSKPAPSFIKKGRKQSEKINLVNSHEIGVLKNMPNYSREIRLSTKVQRSKQSQTSSDRVPQPDPISRFELYSIKLKQTGEIIEEIDNEIDQLFTDRTSKKEEKLTKCQENQIAEDFEKLFDSQEVPEVDPQTYWVEFKDVLQ